MTVERKDVEAAIASIEERSGVRIDPSVATFFAFVELSAGREFPTRGCDAGVFPDLDDPEVAKFYEEVKVAASSE